MTFFESLTKPDWIPPDWAFPAAWFALWILQAVPLAVLVASDDPGRSLAVGLLLAQFVAAMNGRRDVRHVFFSTLLVVFAHQALQRFGSPSPFWGRRYHPVGTTCT